MIRVGKLAVLKVVLALVLVCVTAGVGVASAFAEGETPWWHVLATVAPADLVHGGIGKVVVAASNLGDDEANGSSLPITLTDDLPAGVVPIGIVGEAGPVGFSGEGECSLEAVSCTFRQSIRPYEQVVIELKVRVEADAQSGVNEAVVEGGGATAVAKRQPFTIGEKATPFGVEWFEEAPEGVGGLVDTQAGSHPFQFTTTLISTSGSKNPVNCRVSRRPRRWRRTCGSISPRAWSEIRRRSRSARAGSSPR